MFELRKFWKLAYLCCFFNYCAAQTPVDISTNHVLPIFMPSSDIMYVFTFGLTLIIGLFMLASTFCNNVTFIPFNVPINLAKRRKADLSSLSFSKLSLVILFCLYVCISNPYTVFYAYASPPILDSICLQSLLKCIRILKCLPNFYFSCSCGLLKIFIMYLSNLWHFPYDIICFMDI